jgi:hypothetical protein
MPTLFRQDQVLQLHILSMVENGFNEHSIQLVVERPWLYQISVNGIEVEKQVNQTWLDPDFHAFEVGKLVKEGRNEIELTASPFSIYAELQPVYLLGNFSVLPAEKGWMVTNSGELAMGPWKDQGMPFYGQVVSYKHELEILTAGNYALKLPLWEGTVAEILVNGNHLGIIQSRFDDLVFDLPEGKHEITVNVVGSLKNTLGPHHNVRNRGIVTPWSFKFAPEVQPAGNNYDLLSYGLMKDMEFWKVEEPIWE